MTDAPWETVRYESWTPVHAENALRWVGRALFKAEKDLAEARNAEVEAKHVFEAARREAFFDPRCPKPERGGYTVADREAHIEKATVEQRQVYELAAVRREAAQDHLRTVNSQSMVFAALAKTVQVPASGVGGR